MIVYLIKLFFKFMFKFISISFKMFFKILWIVIKSPVSVIYTIIYFTNYIGRIYNRICKNFFTYPYRLINSIISLKYIFSIKKNPKDLYILTTKPVKIPSINFYPPDPEIPIIVETIFYISNIVLFIYFSLLIRFMMVKTKEKVSKVDWY